MMDELKPCPFCKQAVRIVVCDDEGNIHGDRGCEYEKNPWSGLQYGIAHDGYGECFAAQDGDVVGGILFHDAELLINQWNTADRGTDPVVRCKD